MEKDLIGKKAWILIVNTDNQYEPLGVIIRKTYPSKWSSEHVDYGVEYELIGRIRRVRVPDRYVYFTKYEADKMAQHMNGEY